MSKVHPWHGYGQGLQLPSDLRNIPVLHDAHLVLDPLTHSTQSLFVQDEFL